MISILYTRNHSIYTDLKQDCWNIKKDARKWPGGNPIIAHPPCRAWGSYRHLAKPRPDEKQLAIHAIIMVRLWGGVVEHPRTSTLWQTMNLPLPGKTDAFGGWTLNIDQHWFGHKAKKNTFLYIKGCRPQQIPAIPLTLTRPTREIEHMAKPERERTPEKLAQWLIQLANLCNGSQKLLTWTSTPEK